MDNQYLEVHQTRDHEPTSYEIELAGAVEEIFATGIHDLAGLVEDLRTRGLRSPGGEEWTEESFRSEMARLGA